MDENLQNNQRAFSLLEIIIIVVLIGLIAAFAIPNYSKSIRKSYERDAIVQLTSLHAANKLYHTQAEQYLPTGTGLLAHINSGLNLNIIENSLTYRYSGGTASYKAEASYDVSGSAYDFVLSVTQVDIDPDGSPPNPCCDSGNCPSVSSC